MHAGTPRKWHPQSLAPWLTGHAAACGTLLTQVLAAPLPIQLSEMCWEAAKEGHVLGFL